MKYTEGHAPSVDTPQKGEFGLDKIYDHSLGQEIPSPGEVINASLPPGFVHDMVYATRGIESPTEFCVWAGLFGVSSALQRRAWIWPHPHELFPNLFLVFMSPPALNKKSTTVLRAAKVIRMLPRIFDENQDKILFNMPIHSGSITPEGLFDLLEPQEAVVYEEGSIEPVDVPLGSRLTVISDELATFLGKQSYNEGQITRLINLYDCKDEDSSYTIKGKLKQMKDVFFNFFAATTPDGFQESIPNAARGGGFLSRVSLVYIRDARRVFPIPARIKGASSTGELAEKLAWIARFKRGEYTFSPEALKAYEAWYYDHRRSFEVGGHNENDHSNGRSDTLLMKIVTLIRAQAYSPSRVITEHDVEVGILLTEEISEAKKEAAKLIVTNEWSRRSQTLTEVLRKHTTTPITRQSLITKINHQMGLRELDEVLESMSAGHQITISLDGEPLTRPHGHGREEYLWHINNRRPVGEP